MTRRQLIYAGIGAGSALVGYVLAVLVTLAILTGCSSPTSAPPSSPPPVVNLIGITPPSTEEVVVRSIYDGDTYTLTDDRKIRILGIDTPEMRAEPGDTPTQAEARKCYGHEARDLAVSLLLNQTVLITGDPEQGDKDRYNRLLRYVTLKDGTDVGARLLAAGAARVYNEYPVAKTGSYQVFEDSAHAQKSGGWTACGWTE